MSMPQQVYVMGAPNQGAVGLRTVLTDDLVYIGGRLTTATRTVSGGNYSYSYAPSGGGDTIYRDNLFPGEAYILIADALAFSSAWPNAADVDLRSSYVAFSGTETQRKFVDSDGNTVTTTSYS